MDRSLVEKHETPRLSLLVLGAASFMVIADMRVIEPLLRVIANDFSASVGYTAMIISAYSIPYGLFQLVHGALGDRIGKLRVMAGALAVFAVGTALCAFVPTLPLLILLRFLTGVFAAAIIPLSLAYIGDSFLYAERQTAIARYLSALMLGQILSSSVGGIFGEYFGWRDIFLILGLASLVIALIFWQVTRRIPNPASQPQATNLTAILKPYLRLLSLPAAALIMTTVFVEGFFLFGGLTYIGAFLRDRYSLPYALIGLLLSGFGMGGLFYSASVRWLVQKLGERGLVLLGGWLIGLCFLWVALAQQWFWCIPGTILIGMGFYMFHSTLQTQATELAPKSRGTAVSLFAFSLFLGQGIGAAIMGQFIDRFGYVPCFMITGVTMTGLAIWFARQLPAVNRLK